MIVVLGQTATGKTQLAVSLAFDIEGEIISADSRQVFRNMDIGTGKDIEEFNTNDTKIPYHLIDIKNAGEDYSLYNFQNDFYNAYNNILNRDKVPILCGGTGLYLESVIKPYPFFKVPVNDKLRKTLEAKTDIELIDELNLLKKIHNNTDTKDRIRNIRAIEIELFYKDNSEFIDNSKRHIDCLIFGIYFERDEIRKRITERLKKRLENGMVEEAQTLLNNGISNDKLEYYGLEYKYLSYYLSNKIDYNTMFDELNKSIHQFSKRQMTWFRRMERKGMKINWLDGKLPLQDKKIIIQNLIK